MRRASVVVALGVLVLPSARVKPQPQRPVGATAARATSQPGAERPLVEWTNLPLQMPRGLRDSIRFGYIEVPRDHAEPNGPKMRIAFAVLAARSATPAPDPVVFIVGGPGLPGIEGHLRNRLKGPHPLDIFRERRALIVFDQRGNGYSEPRTCPELATARPQFDDSPVAEQRWLSALTSCRRRLEANGVRIETLSAVQVAHDLELLRRSLGAPQLNIIGNSYGARIAAETVRQVPSTIRAVYFEEPPPPGRFRGGDEPGVSDEVLGALFRRCAEQAKCRTAYPRLQADYDSVIARAGRSPLQVQLPRSQRTPEGKVTVDAELMRQGLAALLANRKQASGVPLLIHTLAEQGLGVIERMAPQLRQSLDDVVPGIAPGTHLAFWCNDGVVSRTSPDRLRQRCRVWLGDAWAEREAEPLRSDIPGLIVAGEIDPRTPPSFARFLAAGLSHAQLVVVPSHGHEVLPTCSFRIARDFFDAPDRVAATRCLDSIPPIDFVTDVRPSRAVANGVAIAWQRPWLVALPAVAALLLFASAVGISVSEIRARRMTRPRAAGITSIVFFLVAIVGLTFLLGLTGALVASMRRQFLIPLIGLPEQFVWLFALSWLLLGLTMLAAYLTWTNKFSGCKPSAVLRRSTLIGAALLLAVCGYSLLA